MGIHGHPLKIQECFNNESPDGTQDILKKLQQATEKT
jgi:hypothetical protein